MRPRLHAALAAAAAALAAAAAGALGAADYCFNDDLVAQWRFDEGSGSSAADSVAGLRIDTESGSNFQWATPNGIIFSGGTGDEDGRSDAADAAAFAEPMMDAEEFTVEAWITGGSIGWVRRSRPGLIFGHLLDDDCPWGLNLAIGQTHTSDSRFSFFRGTAGERWFLRVYASSSINDGSNPCNDVEFTYQAAAEQFASGSVHLVATYSVQFGPSFYVNGEQLAVQEGGGGNRQSLSSNWASTFPLRIGSAGSGTTTPWRGTLRKAAAWRAALDTDSVLELNKLGHGAAARCPRVDDAPLTGLFDEAGATARVGGAPHLLRFRFEWPYTEVRLRVTQDSGGTASPELRVLYAGDAVPTAGHHDLSDESADASGVYLLAVPNPGGAVVDLVFAVLAADLGADGTARGFRFALEVPAPALLSDPSPASAGTEGGDIALTGTNFASGSTVTVGGAPCAPVGGAAATATSLSCTVPPGAGASLDVVVRTPAGAAGGLASAPRAFSYFAPVLSGSGPARGATNGSAVLALTGSNFGPPGAASVSIGGTPCAAVRHVSHSRVECEVPAGQGYGPGGGLVTPYAVRLEAGGQAAADTFPFSYERPAVLELDPAAGSSLGGTRVTVRGSNFGSDFRGAAGSRVLFGSEPCEPVFERSHDEVVCSAPAGSATAEVTVVAAEQASLSSALFTYDAPNITSVEAEAFPTAGGTVLTVRGAGLGSEALGVVVVGASPCGSPALVWRGDEIQCALPAGAGVGVGVSVLVGSTRSNVWEVDYDPPRVDDVQPRGGPASGGERLVVTGANFGAEGSSVTIGGAACAPVSERNHTAIACTVPAGSGLGRAVVVTASDGRQAASPHTFSYAIPSVTGVAPNPGPAAGGVGLVVEGANFGSFSSGAVTVGGEPCLVLTPSDFGAARVECSLPPGVGAGLDVVVTTGGQPSNAFPFSYARPRVDEVAPLEGRTAAGATTVTLRGENFGRASDGGVATVGGLPCVVADGVHFDTRIECVVPAGTGAGLQVEVRAGGQAGVADSVFSYLAPRVDGAGPAVIGTGGGDVTLRGDNFGPASARGTLAVAVGGAACAVSESNSTRVVCALPPGAGEGLGVAVTQDGLGSGASGDALLAFEAPRVDSAGGCRRYDGQTPPGAVEECEAGGTLTVHGANFGPAGGASVRVGGTPCPAAATAAADPHAELRCVLPVRVGVGLDVTVSVAASGGEAEGGAPREAVGAALVSYTGPVLLPLTLRLDGGAAAPGGALVVPDTAPRVVQLDARHVRDAPAVRYGPPAEPDKYACAAVPARLPPPAAPGAANGEVRVSCELEDGAVGAGLAFRVNDTNGALAQVSLRGADTLSYPAPELVAGTIRNSADDPAGGAANVTVSQLGGRVYFAVRHAGARPDDLFVQYGPAASPALHTCEDAEVLPLPAGDPLEASPGVRLVGCRVKAGDGIHAFRVAAGGQFSAPGADLVKYPSTPLVTRVEGCAETATCATAGGDLVTVHGVEFGSNLTDSALSVRVGSAVCDIEGEPVKEASNIVAVHCRLPAGSGRGVAVVVVSSGLFSPQARLMNYAAPGLLSVEGCGGAPCPRDGGAVRLTVRGDNFGPSAAVVTVGGRPCLALEHAEGAAGAHAEVRCDLPAGTGVDRAVVLIQSGGQLSAGSLPLSYEQCGAGLVPAAAGSTDCAECAAGGFSRAGDAQCTQCEAGFAAPANGSTACDACAAGTFSVRAGGAGPVACEPCARGRFNDLEAQGACRPCEVGRVAREERAERCDACGAGTHSPEQGGDECEDCGAGRFGLGTARSSCELCAEGTFTNTSGASRCDACAPGSSAPEAGLTRCGECEAGRAATQDGAASCEACAPGRVANATGSTGCDECAPGRAHLAPGGDFCDKCAVGRYNPLRGQATCRPAPTGAFVPREGALDPEPCAEGTAAGAGASSACGNCTEGRFSPAPGAVSCLACAPGTAAPGRGASACGRCGAGRSQPAQGAAECAPCAPGRAQEARGQGECVPCEAGRAAAANGTERCGACAPGRSTGGATGQERCANCTAGTAAALDGRATCSRCPSGSFSRSDGATRCEPCPAGSVQRADGSSACELCVPGRYAGNAGGVECALCVSGTFAPGRGATSCEACPAGSVRGASGGSACEACAPGAFAPLPGLASCDECPSGRAAASANATGCEKCPSGRHQPSPGASGCLECALGRAVATAGALQCRDCVPGFFANGTGLDECMRCEAGRFSRLGAGGLGASSCAACSRGTFMNAPGQGACLDCPVGRRAPEPGLDACEVCEAGLHAPRSRSIECTVCPEGRFAALEEAFACELCPAGRFSDSNSTSVCEACGAGRFQSLPGQTRCEPCAVGRFAGAPSPGTPGADQCDTCAPGRVAAGNGSSECEACRGGLFQPAGGQTACAACAAGRRSQLPSGSSRCVACPDRTAQPLEGQDECPGCPTNAEADEARQVCVCRAGFFSRRVPPDAPRFDCFRCHEGALCDVPGVQWQNLRTREGWWRSSENSTEFYRCLIKSHCASGLAEGASEGGGGGGASPCQGNRVGDICALCADGYHALSQTADCTRCPSRTRSIVSSVVVLLFLALALTAMYMVVLRADRSLMEDARRRAERRKVNQWAWFEEDDDQGDDAERARAQAAARGIYEKGAGADGQVPQERPSFMYRMKILLGFFQITTNLALALDVQWPTTYQSFVAVFGLVNFDFISWSSIDCLTTTNYYTRMWVLTLTPIVVLVLVAFFYLLPRYLKHLREQDYDLRQAAHERERRQFWKLFLFTLFLIYPGASAAVLRFFVCREVEGESFLVADFSIDCNSDKYRAYRYYVIPFILLYPIGIPAYFFYLLRSNRARLHLPAVRVQLGFLYEAYSPSLWWYEIVDMAHKLFLTSLVAFFPSDAQVPVGVAAAGLYMAVLLVVHPYVRRGDDRLHLFVQTEILMILMAVLTFVGVPGLSEGEEFDERSDVTMSVLLIGMVAVVVIIFVWQVGGTAVARCRRCWAERGDGGDDDAAASKKDAADTAPADGDGDGDGDAEQVENKAEAGGLQDLALPRGAIMVRNPLWDSSRHIEVEMQAVGGGGGGADAVDDAAAARPSGAGEGEGDGEGEGEGAGAAPIMGFLRRGMPAEDVNAGDDDDDDDDDGGAGGDDVEVGGGSGNNAKLRGRQVASSSASSLHDVGSRVPHSRAVLADDEDDARGGGRLAAVSSSDEDEDDDMGGARRFRTRSNARRS